MVEKITIHPSKGGPKCRKTKTKVAEDTTTVFGTITVGDNHSVYQPKKIPLVIYLFKCLMSFFGVVVSGPYYNGKFLHEDKELVYGQSVTEVMFGKRVHYKQV